eukprot:SAG22_NODE_807_length_7081_cov_2.460756_2_plen_201_part_00
MVKNNHQWDARSVCRTGRPADANEPAGGSGCRGVCGMSPSGPTPAAACRPCCPVDGPCMAAWVRAYMRLSRPCRPSPPAISGPASARSPATAPSLSSPSSMDDLAGGSTGRGVCGMSPRAPASWSLSSAKLGGALGMAILPAVSCSWLPCGLPPVAAAAAAAACWRSAAAAGGSISASAPPSSSCTNAWMPPRPPPPGSA